MSLPGQTIDVKFTEKELEQVKAHWKGDPPKECTGKCDLADGCLVMWCKECGWDDWGTPLIFE